MKIRCTFWSTLVLFLLLSLIFLPGFSRAEKSKKGGGLGYFTIGIATINLYNLNSALRMAGYPQLSNQFLSVGGGGLAFINKFVIGGEGSGLNETSITANGNRVSLQGGYGLFEMGYLLFSMQRASIYPLVGISGGGLDLTIAQKNQSAKFDDILKRPTGSAKLSSRPFLIDLGLGGHYFWGN